MLFEFHLKSISVFDREDCFVLKKSKKALEKEMTRFDYIAVKIFKGVILFQVIFSTFVKLEACP